MSTCKDFRLPRKFKKRYKRMLLERLGLKKMKLRCVFPKMKDGLRVEYEQD